MTTQQHDQRYQDSSYRNAHNLLNYKPTADYKIAHFAGMELGDLKHHVGVRKNDGQYDLAIGPWLDKVKDHATKAGITAKSKKKQEIVLTNKEGVVIQTGIDADFELGQGLINVAAAREVKPTAKIVYSAEDTTVHHAPAEKKINPKKAQREAAIASSGTAPGKRINADQQRADAMAAKAKRIPRIMTKQ